MKATKEQMIELVEGYQNIQKVNPPSSVKWIAASKEINVLAKMIAEVS